MIYVVKFNGRTLPGMAVQDCPFSKDDLSEMDEEERYRILHMEVGDTFSFTEIQVIEAKNRKELNKAINAMIEDWQMAHWTDCEWSAGEIHEVKDLDDLLTFLGGRQLSTLKEMSCRSGSTRR